ncbi:MAG TPA: ATP-binding cassette domain-containing protein, partial [Quisquiliibacterium sp.]|nr:ATP-binding cassette domain-containing protein [Quisquiliibacterium sp.]
MTAPASTQGLLSVKGITVRFGGIVALDGVSFDVRAGEVCGLIGPNGAGKTTLFNCLSRLYQYQEGDILFEGKSVTATPVHDM